MQIIKKKLFKSTVAKVMAAAMVVSMIPMPATVSATNVNQVVDNNDETLTTSMPSAGEDGSITLTQNVKLDSDWTLEEDITLDLNGHDIEFTKLNTGINVIGHTLIINDNSGGTQLGTIKATYENTDNGGHSVIRVGNAIEGNPGDGGTVIFNSGNIESMTDKYGYGILSIGTSCVIINGGKIKSYLSPLSGNGSLPNSNFYVLSGELYAESGPCIYKPSPGELLIGKDAVEKTNDGEMKKIINSNTIDFKDDAPNLNGGISLRMGTVKISSGNFTSINKTNLEGNELITEDFYNHSNESNVPFPDTLYILGGTYGEEEKLTNNELDLEISGNPSFTCNQEKGSAVAIYDFGKRKQSINVNISGNGRFTKSSSTTEEASDINNRTAFDVFPISTWGQDITPKNDNLANDSNSITIQGGTFSNLNNASRKYISKSSDDGSSYCVSTEDEDTPVTVAVHNDNITTKPAVPATKDEVGKVAYKTCTNCNKVTVNYNGIDKGYDSADGSDLNLYYLSITEQSEGIEATLTNSSYGKLQDGELIISPKAGYEIVGDVTFTTNPKDLITIKPKENSSQNTSKTYTITAKDNASDLKNCDITIAAQTKKVDYTLTCNSSLKNADAKLADTALNKDGSTTLTITPKAGYGFTATTKPVVMADGATIGDPTVADGVYTYKVSAPTKNCTITVSGEATPVTYKVSLDKSGLKDANAYIIKGDNKVTTETVDATVNDKLQVVVEPNAGKVFTELPTVNGSATTLESGAYKYNVPALTGDTTLKVSGTAEDVKYRIKFANEPTIEHATVKLEPMQAALNGKASLIIEPEAGYRITSTKAEVKDNGKVCTLSETAELGANGVFIYTISDIKDDVEITSVTATVETAELVELGTDIGNANSANLSDTFTIKGSQEEQKKQKENHTNILEAIKDIISKITKDSDSIIFDEKSTLTDADKEKLITEVKEAIESDSSKVALSLEVKEDSTVKEDVKDNAKTEITKKTANSNATVGKLYPLDISLFAHIINKDGVKIKLKDTQKGQIAIKMKKPADIPEKPASVIRRYYMVCFHENESPYTIDVTENEDGTLSFKGSQFSTYILSYLDTPSSSSSISGGGTPVVYPGGSSGGGSGAQSTSTPTPTPAASTTPVVSEAPSTTSSAPNTEPSTIPSAAPSTTPSTPSTPDTEPTAKPVSTVKVGQKVTDASVNYKVTSVSGSRTVTVTGSKSVKNVVIPVGVKINGKTYKVTAIANNAYKGNKNLTKITIGSNVSKIGKNAFSGCVNLKKITIKTTKLTASKVGKNAFKGINKKATIKVPKSKVKTYKKIIKARGISKSVKIK